MKNLIRDFVTVGLIVGFTIGAIAYAVIDFITDGG